MNAVLKTALLGWFFLVLSSAQPASARRILDLDQVDNPAALSAPIKMECRVQHLDLFVPMFPLHVGQILSLSLHPEAVSGTFGQMERLTLRQKEIIHSQTFEVSQRPFEKASAHSPCKQYMFTLGSPPLGKIEFQLAPVGASFSKTQRSVGYLHINRWGHGNIFDLYATLLCTPIP